MAVIGHHFEGGGISRGVHFVGVLADMEHFLVRVLPETKIHLHETDV